MPVAQPKRRLVVLSGAGISAESGIKTFRDAGGLWEGYEVTEVATPGAWQRNPEIVLRFYNERRRAVLAASPNPAHISLAELQGRFEVSIVTQNVDDLHERAGSEFVLHLHGKIRQSRSSLDESLVYDIQGSELNLGDLCELGAQLRPHIVWFGEAVPMMDAAIELVESADILVIVGTSLAVYPAASLADYAPEHARIYLVDPKTPSSGLPNGVVAIRKPASQGVPELAQLLIDDEIKRSRAI